jgi:hypothetical protein
MILNEWTMNSEISLAAFSSNLKSQVGYTEIPSARGRFFFTDSYLVCIAIYDGRTHNASHGDSLQYQRMKM